MEKTHVTTDLVIEPFYFSHDKLYDHILTLLKEKEMTCTQEDGYIDHIYQISDIYNHDLLDSGECCVRIMYEASCFKPDVGKRVKTKVEMVFPHGIFSSLYVLRFLVPYKSIEENYDYIDNECYRHRQTGKVIGVGTEIMIKITNLKYDKGHFSCIAELIDEDLENDSDNL
jgi:DNA-directed RNA polymerase subunit E'/Rpb7